MSDEHKTYDLRKDPSKQQRLRIKLEEITKCLEIQDRESKQITEILDDIKDEFGIPNKLGRKLAKTMYKHNYAELCEQEEKFEFLYEHLKSKKLIKKLAHDNFMAVMPKKSITIKSGYKYPENRYVQRGKLKR